MILSVFMLININQYLIKLDKSETTAFETAELQFSKNG